jgi:para-nitrobenzyl esterase
MPTQEDAEKAGAEFAKALGADDENAIRSLRALPAQAILKQDTGARLPVSVDGWLIPNETASIFAAARHNDVPLIVGSNADEGTAFVRWPEDRSAAAYRAIVGKRFGKLSEQFLRLYPASTDIAGQVAAVDSFRDEVFGWQARTWARHVANSGSSKAYLYYFTRVPPGATAGRYGAYHAAEIPYMFNNLLPPRPWEALDRALAETMLGYWVSFATTGRPGGDGLPLWPAYDPTTGETMELGETVTVRRHVNRAELDFFDAYQQQRREGGANR